MVLLALSGLDAAHSLASRPGPAHAGACLAGQRGAREAHVPGAKGARGWPRPPPAAVACSSGAGVGAPTGCLIGHVALSLQGLLRQLFWNLCGPWNQCMYVAGACSSLLTRGGGLIMHVLASMHCGWQSTTCLLLACFLLHGRLGWLV